MRQIRILSLCLLAMAFIGKAHCQEKKDQRYNNPDKFMVSFGAGFNIFELSYNSTSSSQRVSMLTHYCESFHLYSSYSIFDRFATGIALQNMGYISSTSLVDKRNCNNLGLFLKYTFIYRSKTHVSFELTPTYSFLTYTYDIGISLAQEPSGYFSEYIAKIKRKGFGFKTAVSLEHYFSDQFGIFLRPEFQRLSYSEPDYTFLPVGYNIYPQPDKIYLNNFGASLGVFYRF